MSPHSPKGEMVQAEGVPSQPGDDADPLPAAVQILFLPEGSWEVRESFEGYIQRARGRMPSHRNVKVPGDERPHRCIAEWARLCSIAVVNWVTRLNALNRTLNGGFEASDFVVDFMGHLRGTYKLLRKVTMLTVKGQIKDMDAISGIVKSAIYDVVSRLVLPSDVSHFLSLLEKFDLEDWGLLNIHICHETEPDKSALYVTYYDDLAALEKEDPKLHDEILKAIDVGDDWLSSAMQNFHLQYLMRFHRSKPILLNNKISRFLRTKITYESKKESCLEFRRDGEAHLIKDYSVDLAMGIDVALKAAMKAVVSQNPVLADAFGADLTGHPPIIPGRGSVTKLTDSTVADDIATAIGDSICVVLKGLYISNEVAQAAADAAAITIAGHQNPGSKAAAAEAAAAAAEAAAAAAEAEAAAAEEEEEEEEEEEAAAAAAEEEAAAAAPDQQLPITFAQRGPRRMFRKAQLEHMFAVPMPNLLHSFQYIMFRKGQLADGSSRHRARHICLIDQTDGQV